MSDQALTVHINGAETVFRTWDELQAFVGPNETWWNNIQRTLSKIGQDHASQQLLGIRSQFNQAIGQARGAGNPISTFGQLQNLFKPNGPLLIPQVVKARR